MSGSACTLKMPLSISPYQDDQSNQERDVEDLVGEAR